MSASSTVIRRRVVSDGSAVSGGLATATSNPWLVVVVVCVAQFMVGLDAPLALISTRKRNTTTPDDDPTTPQLAALPGRNTRS